MMTSRCLTTPLGPIGLCLGLLWAAPAIGQPIPPAGAASEAPEATEATGAEPTAEAPPPAEAAPPAEAPAEPVDPAVLDAEGKEAMRAGDCATAAARFDALADALADDEARDEDRLTARFLSGVCYERIDRLQDAAEAYREVVYGGAPAALVEKAEPRLQGIEPLLPVAVTFVCEEEGVMITLSALPDEQKACDEAWSLPSGIYRGAASAPDGREVPLTVHVTPAVPEEVVVLLPAPKGRKLADPPPAPPPPVGASRTIEWVLTTGAVAALGAGVAFNLVARSAVDRGDAAYARYERARAIYDEADAAAARVEVEDARDDADTAARVSYVFFGAGAALGGVALWMWLDDPAPAAEGAAVRVVPGPGSVGIIGRW